MLSICGKDCCEKCSRKESCGGCIKVKGHPFGGQCVAANWVQNFGREGMEERKQALIQEINALSIPDLRITDLNLLNGFYVNLLYQTDKRLNFFVTRIFTGETRSSVQTVNAAMAL